MFERFKKLFRDNKEISVDKTEVKDLEASPNPPEFNPTLHLIDPLQLKSYIEENKKLQVVDVRESHEWKLSRLAKAIHLPMSSLPLGLDRLDKNMETVMVCEHGIRSLDCTIFLLNHGFNDVKSLDGGMANWYFKNGMIFVEKG